MVNNFQKLDNNNKRRTNKTKTDWFMFDITKM